jgi:hypothetical protein
LLELRHLSPQPLQFLFRRLASALSAHLLGGVAVLLLPRMQQILRDAKAGCDVGDRPFASRLKQPNSFSLELCCVLLALSSGLRFHGLTSRILSSLGVQEIRESSKVRIVDGNHVVATHARSWDRGQQIEQAEHLERLTEEKKRARHHRGLDRLAKAAPSSQVFLRAVAAQGQNLGSTTARLLQLLDAVGPVELEQGLIEALERNTVHIGAVRQIPDRRRSERGLPPPLSIPVARGEHGDLVVTPHALSTYDSLKKEETP